jgi:hypothetical protein
MRERRRYAPEDGGRRAAEGQSWFSTEGNRGNRAEGQGMEEKAEKPHDWKRLKAER